MKNVLIVEDDENILELLEIHLKDMGCRVDISKDGTEVMQMVKVLPFDLIVLDLMLPKANGFDLCKQIRESDPVIPILILTARTEEADKLEGFMNGADDYITKPFSIKEFQARINAIFRRDRYLKVSENTQQVISAGDLIIEPDKRKVESRGNKLDVTPREFDLLMLLAMHPGRSYSRESLLNLVWGYDFDGFEHTVNSHINRLRAKIEPNINKPVYILTTWGVGYRFSDELIRNQYAAV